MTTTAPLMLSVEDVLRQGCGLLRSVGSESYGRRTVGPHGSPLGAHYRHVLDHFTSLLEGIPVGVVNYDQRRRSPDLEISVAAAVSATETLIAAFQRLPEDQLQEECSVIYSVGYGNVEPSAVRSNVAREIAFCVGHAIHHYAILRLLCSAMSIDLPYEFGVAPSTLKHQSAQAAH